MTIFNRCSGVDSEHKGPPPKSVHFALIYLVAIEHNNLKKPEDSQEYSMNPSRSKISKILPKISIHSTLSSPITIEGKHLVKPKDLQIYRNLQ